MIERLRKIRTKRENADKPLSHQPGPPPPHEVPVRPRLFNAKSKKEREREFIVIGLGRFGTSLARSLIQHGHDVLGIDVSYQRIQALSGDLPHIIQINAASREALQEIGAGEFDTGIVCIGTDFESNLLAAVLLKELGVPRVIVKARTRTQREILLQVGVQEVILPEHEAGVRLARRLSAVGFVDYLELAPGMVMVEMLAPRHLHGQSLAEANLRRVYGLTVVAIRHGDQIELNPAAEQIIEPGDELLVAGTMIDAERLSD
ncbi:MAG: TrkA family potassium uptake protein [Herpetosiphonaceae bacterium]|nr:TrkA family potassium uptake protein [Herpetosiphonaceae bacterium]